MKYLILVLLITASLSACEGVVIGPVDHSCAVNPSKGQGGSGCDKGG